MSLLGERSASFIVRIWRDDCEGGDVVWRGSVESVRSGDKVYFKDLVVIEGFIGAQLRDIGIVTTARPSGPEARAEGRDGDGSDRERTGTRAGDTAQGK